jgi:4'-phosphopantetheinyl transferase
MEHSLPTECLSKEEKKRAEKFLRAEARRQFVITRHALRSLLGTYLNTIPETIPLQTNQFGKPVLPASFASLHFNVSHSGQRGLIAITRQGDVGVDIEQHRKIEDIQGMARMIFCPADLNAWRELPASEQAPAFYRAWTGKEAMAKASGYGLTIDLKELCVDFTDGAQAQELEMKAPPGTTHHWHLAQVNVASGYYAALAIRGRAPEATHFTFNAQTV